jgi:hypothetical protein
MVCFKSALLVKDGTVKRGIQPLAAFYAWRMATAISDQAYLSFALRIDRLTETEGDGD